MRQKSKKAKGNEFKTEQKKRRPQNDYDSRKISALIHLGIFEMALGTAKSDLDFDSLHRSYLFFESH